MPHPSRRGQFLALIALLSLFAHSALAQSSVTLDSDRDGLSDEFEQALLEKYRPTFMISDKDCAAMPARFKSGSPNPEPAEVDGTIYGQVFPVADGRIEIHYYTLWDRDCGRNSHPLDAEHVAALISQTTTGESKALYWYAGAHEKTVCDISSGARSEAISAEHKGPRVWSSQAKHALYLKQDMCNHGCGADSCENAKELAPNAEVINLGEINAPANGSSWISSPKWTLSDKMDSDFSAQLIARLEPTSGNTVITVRGINSVRGVIQGSDSFAESATSGAQHTGAALSTADAQTSGSLWKATKATGRGLRRAWNAVFVTKKP
jgi:hypothetical protein